MFIQDPLVSIIALVAMPAVVLTARRVIGRVRRGALDQLASTAMIMEILQECFQGLRTVKAFELWNPSDLGYLAGYAAASLASGSASLTVGSKFTAGKLKEYTILAPSGTTGPSVVLGPPTVFDSSNIDQFNF